MKNEKIIFTKAIFLDRDGTINIEKGYLHQIEQFEFIEGVFEALQIFQNLGYKIIIITNQSGIARGYYTEEHYFKLENWMLKELENRNIYITDVLYCPHFEAGIIEKYSFKCNCRKPAIGLFEESIKRHHINVNQSIAVGDRLRDLSICDVSKCKGYLLTDDCKEKPDFDEENYYEYIVCKKNLLEVAKDLENLYRKKGKYKIEKKNK